jgi:peptide/nickel transport system substrate-binding protein
LKYRFFLITCLVITSLLSATAAGAKELRVAYDTGPATLDIQEQLSGAEMQLSHLSFDPLIRWTRDHAFEPRLAISYERLNTTTVRFKLRKGVKFHSGNPMTADDFKWTFNRIKESSDFKYVFEKITALNVVDSHTIDLVTNGPYPLVLHTATYIFPMDSKFYTGTDANGTDMAAIVKNGASFASTHLSGTGPFKVVSREPGSKIVFERFADYWDKSSPGNVDRIVFTPIKDEQARVAALLSAQLLRPDPRLQQGRFDHRAQHAHHHVADEPGTSSRVSRSARAHGDRACGE